MNTNVLVLTLALLFTPLALAQEASCNFFLQFIDGSLHYTCELSFNGLQGDEITNITGNHMVLRDDTHVRAVFGSWGSQSRSFPSRVCVQFPNAEVLTFSSTGLTALDERDFSECRFLRTLRLTFNNISSIHENTFANNQHVELIDLTGNRLQTINKTLFGGLTSLRSLNISSNSLLQIPVGLFTDLVNLEWLSLRATNLNATDARWFETNIRLRSLNLAVNRIQRIQSDDFATMPSLTELRLNSNFMTEFNREAFSVLRNLTVLDMSSNFLNFTANAFEGFSNLHELDLSGNFLQVIEDRAFVGLFGLQNLRLASMGIHEIQPNAFDDLYNLRTLDLSFNRLEELPAGVFRPFTSLSELNLWANRVYRLGRDLFGSAGNLTTLPALTFLDLDSNGMNAVDRRLIDDAVNLERFWFIGNRCANLIANDFRARRDHYMGLLDTCFSNFDGGDALVTEAGDDYRFVPASLPGMSVRVEATAGGPVQIALTPFDFPWRPMLEVIIGAEGNTQSLIRRNRETDVAVAHTPGIVAVNGTSAFTVTWANHLVLVSRANDSFPFLGFLMEEKFNVMFLGLATPEGRGVWDLRPLPN